ncbi:MAG: TfoX/Sxy family protein [Gammaproteobacteria bacterium]
MSDFIAFLHEQFAEFGDIHDKRMFGGHGIYYLDIMIGLVADDVLYLKVDSETEAQFTAAGSQPFMYDKAGKRVKMSYFEAPPETLDDPDEMKHWATLAYEAALRSRR